MGMCACKTIELPVDVFAQQDGSTFLSSSNETMTESLCMPSSFVDVHHIRWALFPITEDEFRSPGCVCVVLVLIGRDGVQTRRGVSGRLFPMMPGNAFLTDAQHGHSI